MTGRTPAPPPAGHDSPDRPWPAASLREIEERLCAPGERFEMRTELIRGVPIRTWKNIPRNLSALAQIGRSHGSRLFTAYEGERVSYDAWFRATAALAGEFSQAGVGRGDRVALAMRNLPEWPVVFFAATSLGAIIVPLNAWWTGPELAYGLGHSGSRLLVCDAERWQRIAPRLPDLPGLESVLVSRAERPAAPALRLEDVIGSPKDYYGLPEADLPDIDIPPDEEATIFYTSGTTGKPKGAVGTHRNILTNIFSSAYVTTRSVLRRGETPQPPQPKVTLTVIPLFHVTACSAGMMGAVHAGNSMIFMHKWDPVKALEIIERERVTHTGGVPTIAWQLLEHPDRHKYDLSSLEAITYGGAPSAPELVRKIKAEFDALPGNGWGMTETSATVTSHSAEDYLHRPDSCGPPVPVADLKIMSEDNRRELPAGEVGELWARGPQVVKGYWNDPEATAATFIDGWVRTGDLARLDEEGFCYIVDRARDIVIRGGENIYSCEVENVLYEHPAVIDAALIGLPHRTLGEEPAAVVQLAPGRDTGEDALRNWVRERLAAFKVPVRIVRLSEPLPRNANGKILKKNLKSFFEGNA